MDKKVNWGILGCASIAKVRMIPGLLNAQNAVLYAVASRGIERVNEFAELFPIEKKYDNYDALLADKKVNAVYIPVPNAKHFEWVEKAAKAGKHILCEKPLALNEREARKMYGICEEEGVLLMEAFAFRHAPLIQKVKEVIDKGTIGKVKYIESHLTDVLEDGTNIRMNQSLGGGSFYDMACYNISTISYLLGLREPLRVKSFAEMDWNYGVDVSNTTLLQYEDGIQAASYSSLNSYSRGYYAVVGEKGRIEVPCNFNCRNLQKFTVVIEGVTDSVEIINEKKIQYTVMCPDNYKLEIEQFCRCILNGEKPLISKEETILNARILDQAMDSVKE
ncbi:MAG: Gfo/Idh/MocA family oxidoreductase [Lachnospiraceae bacterium]|nr:Gfo/Idh/MocA family oxidoreductase [Lachnospiraceae bacterium]